MRGGTQLINTRVLNILTVTGQLIGNNRRDKSGHKSRVLSLSPAPRGGLVSS